jgi:hypothetical protein
MENASSIIKARFEVPGSRFEVKDALREVYQWTGSTGVDDGSRWDSDVGLGSPREMRAAALRMRRMGQEDLSVASSLGKKTSPVRCFSGR